LKQKSSKQKDVKFLNKNKTIPSSSMIIEIQKIHHLNENKNFKNREKMVFQMKNKELIK